MKSLKIKINFLRITPFNSLERMMYSDDIQNKTDFYPKRSEIILRAGLNVV